MLKTAGFMWHRKYVDWYSSKRELLGQPEIGRGTQTNFADQSAIYGLYDASSTCVYIGQAGKGETSGLFERLKAHRFEDSLFCFWERFTWFGLYSADELNKQQFDYSPGNLSLADALNNLESMATWLALPRFNRHYGSGFGHVEWYYQLAEYDEIRKRGSTESGGSPKPK